MAEFKLTSVKKTKADLMEYYNDMSGNHLQYLVNGNHVEAEVVNEVKRLMKVKLIKEAKEDRDRDMSDDLEHHRIDDEEGVSFEDAQSRRSTRKQLRGTEASVFETGYGQRFDGGIDNISKNPLERNIQMAEHYTLIGSASVDNLLTKSGVQDAKGLIAQTKIGRNTTRKTIAHELYNVGIYNEQNTAPMLTAQRRNPGMAKQEIFQSADPDDYLNAFFRR